MLFPSRTIEPEIAFCPTTAAALDVPYFDRSACAYNGMTMPDRIIESPTDTTNMKPGSKLYFFVSYVFSFYKNLRLGKRNLLKGEALYTPVLGRV